MLESNKRIGILKLRYRKVLEVSLLVSLFMVATLFYSFKTFKHESKLPEFVIDEIEVVEIPPTEQNKPKPPPIRPPIPVEAEIDELVPDVEIDFPETNLLAYLGPAPDLPQLQEPDVWDFEAVQEKPVLIEFSNPYYPEMARKAGIEGTVTIKVLIDKKGAVEKAEIFKSIPMLDDAALEAAVLCKFKPAKQRDKCVKVWMCIPFKFKLK